MEQSHDKSTIRDHILPLQGELDMKNNNDSGEMNMNMNPGKNAVELERDMEKRVIREEIVAAKIRRRELEKEVRMELMRENQILGGGNLYGFSDLDHTTSTNYGLLGSQYMPKYDEYLGINPHPHENYEIGSEVCHSKETAFGKSAFDRDPNSVAAQAVEMIDNEITFAKSAFDRDPNSVAVHAVEKVNDEIREELMSEATATASTGMIGMKRKAETPARSCDNETTPTMSNDSQKWFCSLCEVFTTSEVTLNSHFQGKRHKSKEAKSNDTPAIIDNSAPSLQPVNIASSEGDNSSVTKKWHCSLCQLSVTSEIHLISHCQGKKHKAKEAKLQTGEVIAKIDGFPTDKSSELPIVPSNNAIVTAATDPQWYCSLCGVSASSENTLNEHFKGRKHKAKAGISQQGTVNMNHESTKEVPGVEVMSGTNVDEQKAINPSTQLSNDEGTELGTVNMIQESTEVVLQVEVIKENSLDGGEGPKHEQKAKNPKIDLIKDEENGLELNGDSSKKMEGIEKPDVISDGNKKESSIGKCQDIEELVKEGDTNVEFVKYWLCKMCNKGTHDEATMAAHRKSDKHMALLKKHGGGLISVVTIPNQALGIGGISREELSA